MSTVSYRADQEVLDYLQSLETSRCPHLLKPSEWEMSANSEFVYVIWPDHQESFFLFNIWKGMAPVEQARLNWAAQFVCGVRSLGPRYSKLWLDLSPRINDAGDLYLDTDLGIQKYFQNLRPTRERDGLPWSFLSTSSLNKKVVPVIWIGYQVYTILTNGRQPLSDKFRLYLASVPPGVRKSPVGPFPEYIPAHEWGPEINSLLKRLLSVDAAGEFQSPDQAYEALESVLDSARSSKVSNS